jgi:tetratricopeptide (TPR) repeat protein
MLFGDAYVPEPVRRYRWRTHPKVALLGSWVLPALLLLREVWLQRGAGLSSPWLLLGMLGLVGTGIPLLIWAWRTRPPDPGVALRLPGIMRRDRAAQRLFAEERYAEAAELWDEACRDTMALPTNHTLAVYNVGICRLLLGQPEQALALVEAALAAGWHETWSLRRRRFVLHAGHAIALAVVGRTDEAARAQERAHASCPPGQLGMLVGTDAFIAARDGRYAELLEGVPRWTKLASTSGKSPQRRTLAVATAFALEATGADDHAVEAALAEAASLDRGSVDYLATRWPELAAFVARHHLDGAAATEAPPDVS